VAAFLAAIGADAVIVPFSTDAEDLRLAERVSRRLGARLEDPPGSLAAAYSAMAAADLVVAARYHAVLLAARAGVPVVPLAYAQKVAALAGDLGLGSFVAAFDGEVETDVRQAMERIWTSRKEAIRTITSKALELRKRANRLRCQLAGWLENPPEQPILKPAAISLFRDVIFNVVERRAMVESLASERDDLRKEVVTLATERDELAQHIARLKLDLGHAHEALDSVRLERDELAQHVARLEQNLGQAHEALDSVRLERDEVSARLDAIVSTKGYRLLSRWWDFSGRSRSAAGLGRLATRLGRLRRRRSGISWYAVAFRRYRKALRRLVGKSVSRLTVPVEKGLASVVLPVYNGADTLVEAVESVLSQTYEHLELIAVDDGSTDESGTILEQFAAQDPRVRVIHQENRKIPRTLSRGFRSARGEYLTWTSADNRMKPDCLARLVGTLERHPDWDMVYADMDIIGEDGEPLRGAEWYSGYQRPPGSEHIALPKDPSELNTYANNSVGAAFMYRARTAWLLGDYSPLRFTAEDYDYWMRVNELLTLRHADFDGIIYEYRFHSRSLTAREEELGITSGREFLMVFDDFRRDLALAPQLWWVEGDGRAAESLRRVARATGNRVGSEEAWKADEAPELFHAAAWIQVGSGDSLPPPPDVPPQVLRVLLTSGSAKNDPDPGWDLCIRLPAAREELERLEPYRGWVGAADVKAAAAAIRIRALELAWRRLEERLIVPEELQLDATVVVCTHRLIEPLRECLESLARQDLPRDRFEVVVVNNAPGEPELERFLRKMGDLFAGGAAYRLVPAPTPGLSPARNAGLAAARGEIVMFLDDDAVAPRRWVREAVRLFRENPSFGVIGGHIRLRVPTPRPTAVQPGWERYWSQLQSETESCAEVQHWWEWPWGASWAARRRTLLEIGGFRTRYGRSGDDFAGGEEIVAAALAQRLGYKIALGPELEVEHRPVRERFNFKHVRHTIIAGTLTNYQLQRDLYIPREQSLGAALLLLLSPKTDRTVGADTVSARRRHFFYRKEAAMRLVWAMLRERGFARFGKLV